MHKINIKNKILENTQNYENKYDKQYRKEKSQFFTPLYIAQYMVELFSIDPEKKEIKILDPAGGTGILSLFLLLHLLDYSIEKLTLDIYEIDQNVVPVLKQNVNIVKKEFEKSNKSLNINIYIKNFLTYPKKTKYDLIIGNPPYKKIKKDNEDAQTIKDFLNGQPNLYMVFIVQSLKLLSENSELVFIVPRSFFNGKYFLKLRKFIYDNYSISYIHSFKSRSKIINDEVLQELIIIKIANYEINSISITSSTNDKDIQNNRSIELSKEIIWSDNGQRNIRLPTNNEDVNLLMAFNKFDKTFKDLGLLFRTGSVVDFRVKNGIRESKSKNSVPLIWCANFSLYQIKWPIETAKFKQYIDYDGNQNILHPSDDYILVKRFATKKTVKGLCVNVLFEEQLDYNFIGFENHVNYLKFGDNKEFMKAVFILLNSNYYNQYFHIINGTTQINITDLNNLPIFPYEVLIEISNTKLPYSKLTCEQCDSIIEPYL
ncbi:MAG: Eco57I restriction-modification methylase domain-containing protein [Fastidiosipilaceae bacterium]|jgi:adenine-specific DNA-methyltransferase